MRSDPKLVIACVDLDGQPKKRGARVDICVACGKRLQVTAEAQKRHDADPDNAVFLCHEDALALAQSRGGLDRIETCDAPVDPTKLTPDSRALYDLAHGGDELRVGDRVRVFGPMGEDEGQVDAILRTDVDSDWIEDLDGAPPVARVREVLREMGIDYQAIIRHRLSREGKYRRCCGNAAATFAADGSVRCCQCGRPVDGQLTFAAMHHKELKRWFDLRGQPLLIAKS